MSIEPLPLLGLMCAVVSCFTKSFQSFLAKFLTDVHTVEVLVVSCIVQSFAFLTITAYQQTAFDVRRDSLATLFGRCLAGSAAAVCDFAALSLIEIGDATTIGFCSPVFVLIIARFTLKEKITFAHSLAIALTLAGVVAIAKPDFVFSRTGPRISLDLSPRKPPEPNQNNSSNTKPRFSLDPNNSLGPSNTADPRNSLSSSNSLDPNNSLGPRISLSPENFSAASNSLVPSNFQGPSNFLAHSEFLGPNKTLGPSNSLGPKNSLGPTNSQDPKKPLVPVTSPRDRLYGILLELASAVFAAFSIIFTRHLAAVPTATIVTWHSLSNVAAGSAFLGATEKFTFPERGGVWVLMVLAGVLGCGNQYFLTTALKYEQAGPVSIVRTLTIVLTFVWGVSILGETLYWSSALGACLISASVILLALVKWRSQKSLDAVETAGKEEVEERRPLLK